MPIQATEKTTKPLFIFLFFLRQGATSCDSLHEGITLGAAQSTIGDAGDQIQGSATYKASTPTHCTIIQAPKSLNLLVPVLSVVHLYRHA